MSVYSDPILHPDHVEVRLSWLCFIMDINNIGLLLSRCCGELIIQQHCDCAFLLSASSSPARRVITAYYCTLVL